MEIIYNKFLQSLGFDAGLKKDPMLSGDSWTATYANVILQMDFQERKEKINTIFSYQVTKMNNINLKLPKINNINIFFNRVVSPFKINNECFTLN